MRTPIRWDLYGDRGVSLVEIIPIVGQDFTGAAFRSQVRLYPDAPGSALFSPTISLTYGGSATVAAHIAAGRITAEIYNYPNPATGVNYAAGDTIALSLIQVGVDNSLMHAPTVPAANSAGDDEVLAWDLLIDPASSLEDKWIYGSFIVRGTVTQ